MPMIEAILPPSFHQDNLWFSIHYDDAAPPGWMPQNPTEKHLYNTRLIRYAYRQLRLTLPSLCDTPFIVFRGGRPQVLNPSGYDISISHTTGAGGICLCRGFHVGLDIEALRNVSPGLKDFLATPQEQEILKSPFHVPYIRIAENGALSSENIYLPSYAKIVALWCAKEAVGKLTGIGIAQARRGTILHKLWTDGELIITLSPEIVKIIKNMWPSLSCDRFKVRICRVGPLIIALATTSLG